MGKLFLRDALSPASLKTLPSSWPQRRE